MTQTTETQQPQVAGRGPLGLIRRHPLISFFVIAIAFTWTYDLLFLVAFPVPDVPGRSTPRDFGPSVAALVVTAVISGKPGLRRFFQRFRVWRVNPIWYLFIFVGVPLIYTAGVVVMPGALASFRIPSPTGLLVLPVLYLYIVVLGGPLFEEPGWRGFALPRLQSRWAPLAAAVILGVLWAAWHATEYLEPEFARANGGLSVSGAGVFLLAAVCFSIIIAWVFNHTGGSILIAILLHGMINFSQGLTSDLFPKAGFNEVGPVAAFCVVALIIVVATRGRLGYSRTDDREGLDNHPTATAVEPRNGDA
ncbi:MAG TPA: type II CAAX endopeptidase family protein [Candidatus Dormibacteraeota bacterium]